MPDASSVPLTERPHAGAVFLMQRDDRRTSADVV
jgi:hypothetical protein